VVKLVALVTRHNAAIDKFWIVYDWSAILTDCNSVSIKADGDNRACGVGQSVKNEWTLCVVIDQLLLSDSFMHAAV